MELFQILDCSTLGTCCSDYSVVGILSITKRIFGLIQFVVPFILIVAATIQFIQLTINPELKDGFRRVLNKFIAAVIIFMLPVLVDVFLNATSTSFNVSACWKQIDVTKSQNIFGGKYSNDDALWLDPTIYEEKSSLEFAKGNSGGSGNTSTGSLRSRIVAYAKEFKGEKYRAVGCVWNGEKPYKATDCIGFVKGVYKHFGIKSMANAPCGTQSLYRARKGILTQVSEKDALPGDIVLWKGHIAIYMGDGKIIHAAGKKYGVITQKVYKSGEFRGFFRVNGVD